MIKKFLYLVIALVAVAAAVKFWNAPRVNDDTRRQLDSGAVVGFEDRENTHAWLGIPFARPPVGDLRWRPPQPVEPWSGVRESLEHGPMCAQVFPFWTRGVITLGSEDCLYLDVWAPRLSPAQVEDARLPVMVWIHGGANTLGGASATSSHNLAGRGEVIVVSLQYRLGLLGWFSHPALRDTARTPLGATSNFALLDMVMALQWVRDNIAAFGGDPDNVTLFGQSAGAFNVLALMAAPQAEGLFHKAISQSGNIHTVARQRAENYRDDEQPGLSHSHREFINRLLMADGKASSREVAKALQDTMTSAQLAEYLREKPVDELFAGVERRGTLGYFTPTNIRDGVVLPEASLLEVFSDPEGYNQVPVILGSNRDEYKFFLWPPDTLVERRYGLLPEIRDLDTYNRITRYFSDQWQVVGVSEPGRVLSRSQPGQVWAYRFDWAGQKPLLGIDMAELIGAGHGLENTFVFGPDAVSGLSLFAMAADKDSRRQLEDAMLGYWTSFARDGVPGNGGSATLPMWRPWQPGAPSRLVLDRVEAGGIRPDTDILPASGLKNRLRWDRAIDTTRRRCELYVQLFLKGLSTEFWRDEEYRAMGCGDVAPEDVAPVL